MEQIIIKLLEGSLCIVDSVTESVIKRHTSKNIIDFKSADDKVIVHEQPIDEQQMSNIYCLDLNFKILWYAELPYPEDRYPNPISWDTRVNEASTWEKAMSIDPTVFTTSSQRGIAVSINYKNGKIESS